MPGVKGKGGMPPKRSDQRRRGNKDYPTVDKAAAAPAVTIPEPDPEWHVRAREWYLSLAESGQSSFYEPSDWQFARYVADAMSQTLTTSRMSATLFAAVQAGMASLLCSEGDRRRLRLELERADIAGDEPDVSWIDDARKRLRSAG